MSATLIQQAPAAPTAHLEGEPERRITHHFGDRKLQTLSPDTLNAFYLEKFGMSPLPDAAKLLPSARNGFVPFTVRKGLTINGTLAVLRKYSPGVRTADLPNPDDLEANFLSHDRKADRDYGFLFRDGIGPDMDLDNISARQFWFDHPQAKGMTLLERMLIDLYMCWQTIKQGGDPHPSEAYLDWTMGACTICAGTRDHDGNPAIMSFLIRCLGPGIHIGDQNRSARGTAVRRVLLLGD